MKDPKEIDFTNVNPLVEKIIRNAYKDNPEYSRVALADTLRLLEVDPAIIDQVLYIGFNNLTTDPWVYVDCCKLFDDTGKIVLDTSSIAKVREFLNTPKLSARMLAIAAKENEKCKGFKVHIEPENAIDTIIYFYDKNGKSNNAAYYKDLETGEVLRAKDVLSKHPSITYVQLKRNPEKYGYSRVTD